VEAANGLTAILCSAQYAAQAAYDGSSALSAAAVFLPHLVLLDMDTPQMDGYRIAEGLRQLELAEPPVLIAHTARTDVASLAAIAAAGFDLHVSKPCEVRFLLELLKKTVSNRMRPSNQPD
jgi:CheY-like chemotaxis protein